MSDVHIQRADTVAPKRMETGVVQFDGDWPGVFFRGDEAIAAADMLDIVAKEFDDAQFYKTLYGKSCRALLRDVADQLRACYVKSEAA